MDLALICSYVIVTLFLKKIKMYLEAWLGMLVWSNRDIVPILYFWLNVHAFHHVSYFKSRIVL